MIPVPSLERLRSVLDGRGIPYTCNPGRSLLTAEKFRMTCRPGGVFTSFPLASEFRDDEEYWDTRVLVWQILMEASGP